MWVGRLVIENKFCGHMKPKLIDLGQMANNMLNTYRANTATYYIGNSCAEKSQGMLKSDITVLVVLNTIISDLGIFNKMSSVKMHVLAFSRYCMNATLCIRFKLHLWRLSLSEA